MGLKEDIKKRLLELQEKASNESSKESGTIDIFDDYFKKI